MIADASLWFLTHYSEPGNQPFQHLVHFATRQGSALLKATINLPRPHLTHLTGTFAREAFKRCWKSWSSGCRLLSVDAAELTCRGSVAPNEVCRAARQGGGLSSRPTKSMSSWCGPLRQRLQTFICANETKDKDDVNCK